MREPLPSGRRHVARAGAAFIACLVLAACGGGDDGASGGGPLPAGEDGASSPAAEGSRENPSSPQPGSGGGQVAAEDVAQVKMALEQIRTCRPGRTDMSDAAATIVAVLRDAGPEGRYESNDTVETINMRTVAVRARAGLVRCKARTEVQALNAVLRQS